MSNQGDSGGAGTLAERREPALGKIGPYVLEAKIGAGGFGAVYRAHHGVTENTVALKVMYAKIVAQHPEFAQRFEMEAKVGNKVKHASIVKVLDYGEHEGQLYMTMEYLEGTPVDKEVKINGRMPVERAVPILAQVADALGAAHAHGWVHRDIKPANIFLCDLAGRRDSPKVLDFGIAKCLSEVDDVVKTQTSQLLGSPHTMSPEQCRSSKVDHRSDIYSLGIVAFYVLAGQYPFDGAQGELFAAHLKDPPPKLTGVARQIPPQLEAVIERALAKSADERYQTMAEFRDALSNWSNASLSTMAGPEASPTIVESANKATVRSPLVAVPASPPTPSMIGESVSKECAHRAGCLRGSRAARARWSRRLRSHSLHLAEAGRGEARRCDRGARPSSDRACLPRHAACWCHGDV